MSEANVPRKSYPIAFVVFDETTSTRHTWVAFCRAISVEFVEAEGGGFQPIKRSFRLGLSVLRGSVEKSSMDRD